jgi:ATP-dependent Clp protease ATP-binding subunit ClpC
VKLELPFCVCHHSARLVEAWLPHHAFRGMGPSLAELRDDLALQVMIALESAVAGEWRRYQLAPHLRMRVVDIETKAVDLLRASRSPQARGSDSPRSARLADGERDIKRELRGRISVLLEKWPADDFWVATPTRISELRFALRDPELLPEALPRRLIEWSLRKNIESLEPWHTRYRERLEVLEVDANPGSILPGRNIFTARRLGKEAERAETPAEKEERRRRARLEAKTLREAARNLSYGVEDETLERCFGRERLVEELTDDLLGREGVALVLVGPSGVGKSAIVHELVRRLAARHNAAGARRDVWRIDGSRFIAGQSFVGQWEARAGNLARELVATGDILFADDLASLVFAGRTRVESTNLAQYLEPQLRRGELSILGECTPERWECVREEAPGFAALFRVVHVAALSAKETLPVLLGALRDLESPAAGELPPRLSPAALETLLDSATRFRPHEVLPGRAVRLLRRVLAGPGQVDGEVRRFGVDEVWAALRAETGLPDFVLGAAPPRSRDDLRRQLSALVAGQPDAIEALVDAVLVMQAGLGDPDKPLSTYLLVGPTGVGKTESAKALAKVLFGGAERLLRFDMSEFVSSASLQRFVGSPGAPDGELTSALRAQPLRVILLDEIEKAHPRVFDALLQLLGEGRLTDAAGRTADARQAVILMTSNLGVREAAARPGFVQSGDPQHYLSAVRAFFRPEFFNRLDRVVPYRPLDRAALRVVVQHALEDLLSRRGIQRGHVLVDVEPDLLELLVEQAFDPRYGARPLKRLIERHLTVPLAQHLVTRRGDDLALVEMYRKGDQLGLSVRLLADAAPLADDDDPARWSRQRLAAEITSLRERFDAGFRASVDLAENWHDLKAAFSGLDDDALESVVWEEDVGELDGNPVDRSWTHHAGHMGLRQKRAYKARPMTLTDEAQLRRVRPLVAQLRDGVALLQAREGAPLENGGLVIECVGTPSPGAMGWVLTALPKNLSPAELWVEEEKDFRQVKELPGSYRRVAMAWSTPALASLLKPLVGWALIERLRDGILTRTLVRVRYVDGVFPDALAAHDARATAERAARRCDETPQEPGVLVLRGQGSELVHVATGRDAHEHAAILAAGLRAK